MKSTVLAVSLLGIGLSACSSESPEPVEQIIIREPGQSAAASLPTGDLVAAGRAAFAGCAACHSVEAGETGWAGPTLYGVVGRAAGSVAEYDYSDAMAASGLTWTDSNLDAFLTNPSAKVPGTSMAAGSVGNAEERSALIAYLATLSK